MTDLLALPQGTTIRLIGSERGGLTLDRTGDDLWSESAYHCVDCAEEYTNDEMQALVDAAAIDGEPFEVLAVPADWLRDELRGLMDSLDEHVTPGDVHDALRALAVDAGLS